MSEIVNAYITHAQGTTIPFGPGDWSVVVEKDGPNKFIITAVRIDSEREEEFDPPDFYELPHV